MNIESLFDGLYDFYLSYPVFCYVAAGLVLLLAIWKPAKVFKTLLTVLVFALILYIALSLVDSVNFGNSVKQKAIHRTEKEIVE